MGDLRELEKQIAAATGPTFALDQMIGEALVYPRAPFHNHPPFTASIDAAVALCKQKLPGWHWTVSDRDLARVSNPSANQFEDDRFDALAATPALALCLAVVRALIPPPGGGGET